MKLSVDPVRSRPQKGETWVYARGETFSSLWLVLEARERDVTLLDLESGNVAESYAVNMFLDRYLPWERFT